VDVRVIPLSKGRGYDAVVKIYGRGGPGACTMRLVAGTPGWARRRS